MEPGSQGTDWRKLAGPGLGCSLDVPDLATGGPGATFLGKGGDWSHWHLRKLSCGTGGETRGRRLVPGVEGRERNF